jgi:two-component system, OmpR family, sensor kinase
VTLSIRQRLTLWYTFAVATLLGVTSFSLIVVYDRISLARLDTELERLNDAVATVLANELIEKPHAYAAAEEALIEVVVPARHLAILSRDGVVLAQRWTLPITPAAALRSGLDAPVTLAAPRRARMVAQTGPPVPEGFTIITAATWDELTADRANVLRALLLIMPFALVATAAGASWIAGRVLKPAAAMAKEAQRLTEHSAGQRLTIGRHDELGRLAVAFNGLVDRLESALAVQRQFLADASHELRTPVSIARTAADVALNRTDRTEAEYREALEIVAVQMKHLGRLVSDMLLLARSDATDWPLAVSDFYFDELVDDVMRAMALMASAKGVTLDTQCPAELQVHGDEALLQQMLVNLLENAVRHTPAGGQVHLTVTAGDGRVTISLRDTGSGIPEAERDRVFDRFVHLASPGHEAERRVGGTGLGLAIARRIARAHGGDITLASTGHDGTLFVATLASSPSSAVHPNPAVPRS